MKDKNVLLWPMGFGSKAFQNLTAALFLLTVGLHQAVGQSMRILEKDDTETTYALSNLKSLVFTKTDMTIEESGQSPVVVVTDDIRYLSFSNLTNIVDDARQLIGKVHVYPNPVANELHVEWTESLSVMGRIEVIAMNGMVVHVELADKHRSSCQIDVSRLSQGIYICKVHLEDGVKTIKFHKL